ncbi:hypothetical protein KR074_003108 [Drosophila pseudoananassae]|nr:hypothetical protein KR074_003108 [Drosophila pseudoananassae]
MSKLHTLWGALLNHFLFVVRLIANMSSPIYEQYRCASWKPKKVQDKKEATKQHESRRTGAEELLMPNLQPEPLATMMSFQLMAMDVVTQMQTALHKCVNAAQSPPKMPGLEAFQRSPCYFFIDLHPFKEAAEEVSSSQLSSDKNNNGSPAKAPLNRQRSISECSEDSFICFEDDDDENDEDDDDEAGEDDGDDDDDDDSSVQFTACCDDDDPAVIDPCECPKNDSSSAAKKVRFNLKPEVHVMLAWDFAYRAARKSEWQLIARDRDRFQKRIKCVAPILNPILSPTHRDNVYKARFWNVDED